MVERDEHVAALLERLAPPVSDDAADWDAVAADAMRQRVRRRWVPPAVLIAGAAAVALATAITWSTTREPLDPRERAIAALGDGPVVHVVFREEWGGTLVDLRTGERNRLHAEREVWYDAERGLREVSRLGGVVQSDVVYPPKDVPQYLSKTYAGLVKGYRTALEAVNAHIVGSGRVDGVDVLWIRVADELLPDVADDRLHEWAHDIAVAKDTYEPVGTRETRDGKPGPQTGARILKLERLPASAWTFERDPDDRGPLLGGGMSFGRELAPFEAAARLPGAVWAGREVNGLELARIAELDLESGRGHFRNWTVVKAVSIVYGRVTEHGQPDSSGPFIRLTESPEGASTPRVGARFLPPEGSVFLSSPQRGVMLVGSVVVTLEASREELLLAAARALRPIGS